MLSLQVSLFAHTHVGVPTIRFVSFPHDFNDFREADGTPVEGVKDPGKDGLLWSPAIFGPSPVEQFTYRKGVGRVLSCAVGETRRNKPCVVSVCALVLDYDYGSTPADEVVARWAQHAHVLHSTYTPGRWRVILPYAAPVTPEAHDAMYAWAIARENAGARRIDTSTSDASRIFYWPTCRTDVDAEPVFGYNPGELLDPARTDLPRLDSPRRTRSSGSPPSQAPPYSPANGDTAAGPTEESGTYAGLARTEQREDLTLIESRCRFMAHVRADAATLPQPEWYAALGIIARCRGGDDLAHEVSAPYPTYSPDETEETYQRAKASAGPRTCADIRKLVGPAGACRGCTLQVTSPVLLGRAAAQSAGRPAAEIVAAKDSAYLDDAPAGAPAAGDAEDLQVQAAEAHARYQQARLAEDAAVLVLEAARRRLTLLRRANTSSEDDLAEGVKGLGDAREQHRFCERVRKAREKEHAAIKAKLGVEGLPPGADPNVWQRLRLNREGNPLACMANLLAVLDDDPRWSSRLTYDAFALDVCLDGAPLPEEQATRLAGKLGADYHLDASTPLLLEGVRAVACARRFHPIQDWLGGLRPWDGTPRVRDLLLRGFGADPAGDEELVVRIGEQFMLSLLARAYKPGAKVDTMLVLTGKQGMYKSTSFEALVGTPWFLSTKLDLHNKDSFIQLRGKWLVEFGELAAVKRADDNVSKGWLSSSVDNYRAPYARRAEDHPRSTVACGTTNEEEFLADPTGYRRYRPVSVGRADIAWIREHREMLFAEALVIRAAGGERATWWFDESDDPASWAKRLKKFVGVYVTLPPWTETVHAWLEATATDRTLEVFSIMQVLTRAVQKPAVDVRREDQTVVGNILKYLECERVDRMEQGGHTVTRYRRSARMMARLAAGGKPAGTVTEIHRRA